MYECRNYRCRRTVAEPRILPLPDGWTSIVCPHCDAVMQLVSSPDIGSGGYFNGLRPSRANDQAYDAEARGQLRVLSEELTGVR